MLELMVNLTYSAQIAKPAADENTLAVSGLSGALYGKLRVGKSLLELAYISLSPAAAPKKMCSTLRPILLSSSRVRNMSTGPREYMDWPAD